MKISKMLKTIVTADASGHVEVAAYLLQNATALPKEVPEKPKENHECESILEAWEYNKEGFFYDKEGNPY